MKKLGLRAVAGSLALLLTASAFAPATKASAADMLVTAKAPKTLVITADMVDDDGEIVISNEDWDCIIVENGVDAKNIYFDGVEVKELVVESGSKTKVQLWDVDAAQVTVQEPEFEAFPIKEMLALLTDADDKTRQQLIDKFNEYQANVNAAKKLVPSIATKEGAEVEALVVHANAKLDLGEGAVDVVALEAGEKVSRANVTLSNYNGDVTYKGGEGFSAMTLKTVNSDIKNLKVEDSNAENYFTVTAQNAKIAKTEVAGNAKVSLNAPMGEVEITEAATAANVSIMSEVDDLKVAGKGAKVDLAGNAEVKLATVTSDNVKISGAGSLGEADLQGKGGYVDIFGSKVEGENTYVPYEAPKVVVTDVDVVAGDGTSVTKNANGSATISFSGQYKSASLVVPDNVDVNRIKQIILNVTMTAQCGLSVLTKTGEAVYSDYPGYGINAPTEKEFIFSVDPAEQKIGRINFMSLNASQPDMTVNSVTFMLYETAPAAKPTPPPAAPGDLGLSENSKEYNFADLTISGGWGNATEEAIHDGLKITYERQYAAAKFALPEPIKLGDLNKVIMTASSMTGPVGVEFLDASDNKICFWWNKKVSPTTDIELTFNTLDYGGNGTLASSALAKEVVAVNVMYHGEGEGAEAILYRIAFDVKEGGSEVDPNPGTGDNISSMKGEVDLSTKKKIAGELPTESEGSLAFVAGQNKCAFDLPDTLKMGEKMDVTVDFDFTTLDTNSTVRFYLIKDSVDMNVAGDPICISTGEVDATSVKTTFTIAAEKGDATQILFVTYANDGSTPQAVTLNGITIGAEEEPAPEPEDKPTAPSTLTEDWEVYTAADFTKGGYGYKNTDAEYYDGENVAIEGQYQEIRYTFAEDVDLSKYEKMLLTFSTKSADAADYVVIKLVDKDAELDEYNNNIPMHTQWDCAAVETSDLVIDLADYAEEKLSWVAFMAKNGATDMTFYRIALLPKEGSTTPEVTPVEDLVIYPGNLQSGGWGMDVTVAEEGAVDFAATGTYKTFFYEFAETIDVASYERVVFRLNTSANLALQLIATDAEKDSYNNPIAFVSKNCNSADVVEVEIPLDLYAGKQINRIGFSNQGDQPTGTVYSITFVGREDGPADPVVLPEDGTICTPNSWEVVKFAGVDFREYAGKTVKITVDVMRVGGAADLLANGQFCGPDSYAAVQWQQPITTEWTSFGSDAYAVPADVADYANALNYGIRTVDGQDYSQSLIFYRNFSVTVVE